MRVFFDLAPELGLAGQRRAAVAALFLFLLVLELPLMSGLFRYGRHLEMRLRQAFLEKIPRLSDRYFQGRLKSDMAHVIHQIRHLPDLGSAGGTRVLRTGAHHAGIAWLDPPSAPIALVAALLSAG